MYTMKRHNGHNTRITKFTMILMIKRLTEGDLVNTESRFFLPVARATRIPASRDSRIATDSSRKRGRQKGTPCPDGHHQNLASRHHHEEKTVS
jgi:hypothetical protein